MTNQPATPKMATLLDVTAQRRAGFTNGWDVVATTVGGEMWRWVGLGGGLPLSAPRARRLKEQVAGRGYIDTRFWKGL